MIGIDNKQAFTPLDCRTGPENAPDALKTPLGWVLYGPLLRDITEPLTSELSTCHVSMVEHNSGPPLMNPAVHSRECGLETNNFQEDRISLAKMKKEVTVVEGHVQLPLLWRDGETDLPDNRRYVENRLACLKRRLPKDEKLHKKYVEVMESYFSDGYAEKIWPSSSNPKFKCYLPHQPVVNPKKPEKLRIVFDCGAEYQGKSLNNFLMHGPDLTPSLVSVLTQFRQGKVAIVADVKSMFHKVKVNPQDTNALRFLWWPEGDLKKEPVDCRMLVHLFGANSSSSTAAFALRHTVELFGNEYSPDAVNVVLGNFYADDMLMSTDSVKDGIQLANEVKEMLSRAGFDLHKWSSNCEDILSEVITKRNESSNHTAPCKTEHCILGVQWFVEDDAFKIRATLLSIYSIKEKFPVFMANRLAEIEETTSKADWKYVPTNVNPADDISEGLVIKSFVQRSNWLTGQEFLKQSPLDEPQAPESIQMVQRKLKSNQVRTINALPVVFSGTDDPLPIDKLITYHSSLHKLKIAALWLLRFGKFLLAKVRQRTNEINASLDRITVNQTDKIEKLMIRYEQRKMYPKLYHVMVCNKQLKDDACTKSIRRYSPIMINGLNRVKGCLNHDLVGLDEKFPILLSGDSHLTKLIITECLVKSGHCGLNHTFTCLREHY